MPDNLMFEGLSVAPNVIETIVGIASEQTEGVAYVGSAPAVGAASLLKARSTGVEVGVEDGSVAVAVHLAAYHGVKLRDLGAAVQRSVADALAAQLGVEHVCVDVFVDALEFAA